MTWFRTSEKLPDEFESVVFLCSGMHESEKNKTFKQPQYGYYEKEFFHHEIYSVHISQAPYWLRFGLPEDLK